MIAYNKTALHNLHIIKEARAWAKKKIITSNQLSGISDAYPATLYHPNIVIRLLIFIASLIGIGGVTGLLTLIVSDSGEPVIYVLMLLYGLGSWVALDRIVINLNQHYKSGLTEALLYHSMLFVWVGLAGFSDFDTDAMWWLALPVLIIATVRYLDLISTVLGVLVFAYLIFDTFYNLGGIFQIIIPFVFLAVFTPLYFIIHAGRKKLALHLWSDVLLMVEVISLLFTYAAGNYLVVRELTLNLMYLELAEGEDIPYAWVFYGLTVLIPLLYLYVGIKKKDRVLLRVSLLVLAFSVFTFKYYYSLGHPEITITLAGVLLLATAFGLQHFLRSIRNGYTRENLLDEKWGNTNAEAFVIAQTLGGNQAVEDTTSSGGGGEFGGGGSSESF